MKRRVEFVRFDTPDKITIVEDAFERSGFYDQYPEQCMARTGMFLLWDPDRRKYVIILCSNQNGSEVWQ